MEAHDRDDDEGLFDELREALRRAGPVDDAVAAGSATFTWRTIDEELAPAVVVFDSQADGGAADGPRRVVFATESVSLQIELETAPPRLRGRVLPPAPGAVELLEPGGMAGDAVVDDRGRFTVEARTRGPVRLRYQGAGGAVITDWFTWSWSR